MAIYVILVNIMIHNVPDAAACGPNNRGDMHTAAATEYHRTRHFLIPLDDDIYAGIMIHDTPNGAALRPTSCRRTRCSIRHIIERFIS